MASRYSDEEVEAIFKLALERQAAEEDGFDREELVAAAREVGLDDDAVDRAIVELESERGEEALYERVKKKQREAWLRHFVTYLIIVGGFTGMHLLGFVGAWVAWMAFGWGIGIAMHTFNAFRGPTEEDVEKERQRLNRKARREAKARARQEARRERRRQKAERERQRRARDERGRRAGDELEQVIEEGVALLLSAAARKIREAAEQAQTNPDSEFGRYVARKKSGERGASAGSAPEPAKPDPVRARVEVEAHDEAEEADDERADRRRRRERRG